MKRILIVLIISLLSILIIDNNFYCTAQEQYKDDGIWINNVEDRDINVIIKDITMVEENVKLRRDYDNYVIVTMEVYNTSLDYVELSNINLKAYQNNNSLETFIKSNESEYVGFVGRLESGENKTIKVCIAVNDQRNPLKLVFSNVDAMKDNKRTKIIYL